jgi:hypothetical protein
MDILNRRGVALKNKGGPKSHVLSLFQLFPHFYSPLGAKFANSLTDLLIYPTKIPNKNTEIWDFYNVRPPR